MCLMLYIATHDELPESTTKELTIAKPRVPGAERWLTLPHVRFVGAQGGCSCAFALVTPDDDPIEYYDGLFSEEDEEREQTLESTRALLDVIRTALSHSDEVQFYPVWAGQERTAPRGTIELNASELNAETFFFNEQFLYRIHLSS
jgi:hypothetical protein